MTLPRKGPPDGSLKALELMEDDEELLEQEFEPLTTGRGGKVPSATSTTVTTKRWRGSYWMGALVLLLLFLAVASTDWRYVLGNQSSSMDTHTNATHHVVEHGTDLVVVVEANATEKSEHEVGSVEETKAVTSADGSTNNETTVVKSEGGASSGVNTEAVEGTTSSGAETTAIVAPETAIHEETPEVEPRVPSFVPSIPYELSPEGTYTLANQIPGYFKHPSYYTDTYLPRGKPLNETTKQQLAKQWGSWTLVDAKAKERPGDEWYNQFPSRDVPWKQFPAHAWQTDPEYMKQFIPQAKALGA
jgi:hypothetical protein